MTQLILIGILNYNNNRNRDWLPHTYALAFSLVSAVLRLLTDIYIYVLIVILSRFFFTNPTKRARRDTNYEQSLVSTSTHWHLFLYFLLFLASIETLFSFLNRISYQMRIELNYFFVSVLINLLFPINRFL